MKKVRHSHLLKKLSSSFTIVWYGHSRCFCQLLVSILQSSSHRSHFSFTNFTTINLYDLVNKIPSTRYYFLWRGPFQHQWTEAWTVEYVVCKALTGLSSPIVPVVHTCRASMIAVNNNYEIQNRWRICSKQTCGNNTSVNKYILCNQLSIFM